MTAIVDDFAAIRGAAGAAGSSPPAGSDAQILDLFCEWRSAMNRFLVAKNEEMFDLAAGEMIEFEDKIAAIPAQTIDGLAIKVFLVARDGWLDGDAAPPLCRSIIEDAARLAPDVAAIHAADQEFMRQHQP